MTRSFGRMMMVEKNDEECLIGNKKQQQLYFDKEMYDVPFGSILTIKEISSGKEIKERFVKKILNQFI